MGTSSTSDRLSISRNSNRHYEDEILGLNVDSVPAADVATTSPFNSRLPNRISLDSRPDPAKGTWK